MNSEKIETLIKGIIDYKIKQGEEVVKFKKALIGDRTIEEMEEEIRKLRQNKGDTKCLKQENP